ncbi:MAG: hypothetical protein F9K39_13715 [Exiguobacterium chiriqhucha]|uniref:hypothetical protein n=1 Tax=Exiguobacterium chiriqhucha TaxID=1385984 RepID=UPI00144EE0E0|nr:hypothetical protein [Exiguobacterium chiriqhucha]KAB2861246.1 MAG: hypothetical protein F9K39_13715 [Exiguobacterium chiriqhucha]
MKKLLLSLSLFAGTTMNLTGCGGMGTVETIDDRPVIHFDAASIISSARDHQIKMLTLSSVPTDVVAISGAVKELQGMQADNDMYLSELKGMQHEESAADEFKDLVVEYLEAENAYIIQTIEALYGGGTSRPSRFSMESLYSRANAQISDFRYEPK